MFNVIFWYSCLSRSRLHSVVRPLIFKVSRRLFTDLFTGSARLAFWARTQPCWKRYWHTYRVSTLTFWARYTGLRLRGARRILFPSRVPIPFGWAGRGGWGGGGGALATTTVSLFITHFGSRGRAYITGRASVFSSSCESPGGSTSVCSGLVYYALIWRCRLVLVLCDRGRHRWVARRSDVDCGIVKTASTIFHPAPCCGF